MKNNQSKRTVLKVILALLGLVGGGAYGQKKITYPKLQQLIDAAYLKAYPACVKLYAYDTVSRQQAGGVFSGVVVSKDGHILTAAHVTSPGVVYKVNFPDGRWCLAAGLGKIELLQDKTLPDVGMIRIITKGNWPFASLGRSSSIKKNEPCISISYPESLDQSIPVLRFGRVVDEKNDRGFLKSTCIMEPGDSGGALFDYNGKLIGLHSAIEVPEESNYDVLVDLYLKYCTALNKPFVYTKYPEVADSIPAEKMDFNVSVLPALKCDRNNKVFGLTHLKCVIMIYSHVTDVLQSVSGTVFSVYIQGSKRSFIVSKSSMVGSGSVFVKVGKTSIDATVISRDKQNDLVLLSTNKILKGGLDYASTCGIKDTITAGKFLLSLKPGTSGVISISGAEICSIPKKINAPFVGVGFKTQNAPFIISYIFPNLNKTIDKLKIGDELLSINNFTSSTLKELFDLLKNYWPGDTVKLKLKRSRVIIEEEIVLDEIPLRHVDHPAEFFAGGKSYRRDGFNSVFLHDAVLKPDQCGGPVFDLSGKFCGINIARYSRAICLAVPGNLVLKFIDFSLSKSVHAPYHEWESK